LNAECFRFRTFATTNLPTRHELSVSGRVTNLSTNATLVNTAGTTTVLAPLGSPYVSIRVGDGDGDGDDVLRHHESGLAVLEFLDPSGGDIEYDTRVLNVTPAP